MPTKIRRLKEEAKEPLKFRGHSMTNWKTLSKTHCISSCVICGATCIINSNPLPNGIDICGSAVALHCKP